jgi:hypothetical protein
MRARNPDALIACAIFALGRNSGTHASLGAEQGDLPVEGPSQRACTDI